MVPSDRDSGLDSPSTPESPSSPDPDIHHAPIGHSCSSTASGCSDSGDQMDTLELKTKNRPKKKKTTFRILANNVKSNWNFNKSIRPISRNLSKVKEVSYSDASIQCNRDVPRSPRIRKHPSNRQRGHRHTLRKGSKSTLHLDLILQYQSKVCTRCSRNTPSFQSLPDLTFDANGRSQTVNIWRNSQVLSLKDICMKTLYSKVSLIKTC